MVNSRQKGKRGELELAKKLREYGYTCRRGQQYCGANGDADVVGIPGVHIECKRTNRISPYDLVEQAQRDAKEGELPIVFLRRDNSEWLALMPMDVAMRLIKSWEVD